ncbi:hypothetical protein RAA17_12575 [Komagataeibacter rhaeticus]|nr:hypothetical protein [Komagataeibacter rhaeticus]
MRAAYGLVLLCPQIPLLFMGRNGVPASPSCSLPATRPNWGGSCATGGAGSLPVSRISHQKRHVT